MFEATSAQQLNAILYLAIVIIGFFIVRTLRQVDANQTKLWDHMNDVEVGLSEIKSAHNTMMQTGGHGQAERQRERLYKGDEG
jgi:uncharacterized membrane-anchored protein YhcB (DUF1043 family)